MEQIIVYLSLIITGLVLGSFAGASVWRLRARQLKEDKALGEKVDDDEYKSLKKLSKVSFTKDRSVCLGCSYRLRWYDLVPVISWAFLGGRCRKCKSNIGYMEPLIEISVALFFVLSYVMWPYGFNDSISVISFVLWLVAGVGLAILFVYDAKWLLLPDSVNFFVMGIGVVNSILVLIRSDDLVGASYNIIGSVLILSGIYWFLYIISRGTWVGFGDIKLGLGLAFLLADWQLAFVALFSANLIGCFIVIPAIITGKLKRSSRVPFGPLLIAGFVVAGLVGADIVGLYTTYFLGL